MKLPTHEMIPDKNALNGKVPTRQPRRFSFDFEYGDEDVGTIILRNALASSALEMEQF